MLEITIYYSEPGVVASFEATGHARYSPKGSDIVCAGASAIIQTAIAGLDELLNVDFGIDQQDGDLYVTLPYLEDETAESRVQLILGTMILGLRRIMQQYPENVRIIETFIDGTPAGGMSGGNKPERNGGADPMPGEYNDVEIIEPKESGKNNPYSFEKLFGVAFLGAVSGLLVYYVYNQLSDESKKLVKETIVTNVRRQIASLGQAE